MPAVSLATVVLTLVSWFVTVTVAAGTEAPDESVTRPVMIPRSFACPNTIPANRITLSIERTTGRTVRPFMVIS